MEPAISVPDPAGGTDNDLVGADLLGDRDQLGEHVAGLLGAHGVPLGSMDASPWRLHRSPGSTTDLLGPSRRWS